MSVRLGRWCVKLHFGLFKWRFHLLHRLHVGNWVNMVFKQQSFWVIHANRKWTFFSCNRQFKQQRFWATHANRKWTFSSLLIYLEATKFVLLSVLILKRQFSQEFVQNLCRRVQKVQFRLTCVAQKHLCLSSLIYLDAIKFVLLSVFTLKDTFCQEFVQNHGWRKRGCLKSLYLPRKTVAYCDSTHRSNL